MCIFSFFFFFCPSSLQFYQVTSGKKCCRKQMGYPSLPPFAASTVRKDSPSEAWRMCVGWAPRAAKTCRRAWVLRPSIAFHPRDAPSGSSPCCLLSSESFSLLILDSGSVCGPTLRKGFVGPSGFCSESSSAVQGVWRAEPRHSAWPALGKPHRNHCSSEACTQPECSECCVHGRIAFGALLWCFYFSVSIEVHFKHHGASMHHSHVLGV